MADIVVGASWSAEDDIELDSMKSNGIKMLAAHFKRGDGAIRSRLKHLSNPEHKAYHRLHGTVAPPQPKRQKVESTASTAALLHLSSLGVGVGSSGDIPSPAGSMSSSSYAPAVSGGVGAPSSAIFGSSSSSSASASSTAPASAPALALAPASAATAAAGNPAALIRSDTLTPTQLALATQAIHAPGNVFLTGAAGVVKSYLLLYIIEQLKLKHARVGAVAVTAPTGIAALHILGQTIYSFAGIGLGRNNKVNLFQKLSAASRARWAACEVLVIDEISMLDSTLFDKLDFIARGCKPDTHRLLPFGGIKLVLSGDFFQLPPVGLGKFGSKFTFDSVAWAGAGIATLKLTEIVRQSDPSFMTLLNEVRVGVCSPQTTALLARCHTSVKPVPADGIVPTKLYCINYDVDGENATQLAALPGALHALPAADVWQSEPSEGSRQAVLGVMDKKCPAVLSLKVGVVKCC